ncbi:MAG TPA: ABC transporter permease [Candidatus Limiplasma sp.]|nr:ABC transporter permease [Candidatus Limiplasma sp.]HPS80634.1 ABC transporter permease [Candidatus Limiplasma sp.]
MRACTVARRVIRQIVKDRRTMALMFIAPIAVIFLLYTVLNADTVQPRVIAVGLPAELTEQLAQTSEVTEAADATAALETLRGRDTDGVVTFSDSELTLFVEGTDPSVTASMSRNVASAVAAYSEKQFAEAMRSLTAGNGAGAPAKAVTAPQPLAVTVSYLNGSADVTGFDLIAPLLMGFFIFFFVFLLAGVAFLRERTTGTLERLLATPVRRHEIVMGYFLGFGVFVFFQTILIQSFMVSVLQVPLKGDFYLVALINLLLAAGSLALGTLLSAFARNELQMFQFIPVVIVPQVLFCGLFSLRGAPRWVDLLSKAFPLTYAAEALNDVALRGNGFETVWPCLLALFGYVAVFLFLNTLALKKYRRL